ncbi:MAG: DUF1003 domain-containing protein [Actinoallomurus sp.]
MSLFTDDRHPRAHARRHGEPVRTDDEHIGFNGRMAAWITAKIGSMWTVYISSAFCAVWMLVAQTGPLSFDRYPFPFLLFLGNVVQLLLIFIILLGQQVLGRVSDKRALQTYEDAEAILHDCRQIQNHLIAQDTHLANCSDLAAEEHDVLAKAAERLDEPPKTADEYVGFNGRLAAWITNKVGTMTAFYIACVIQFGWMALAQTGVINFDRYPFSFLLFLSSLAQLLLMFIVMVGQNVIGKAADARATQTYLNAQAVRHACERLQTHLKAQDLAILHIVEHMEECRSQARDRNGELSESA